MKKITPKEPKRSTLVMTALSGVMLGVLLAVSLLLSRPPTTVTTPPDESLLSKPGNYNTYYFKGRVDGAESANLRSGTGRIKRRSPGPVSFSEGELNHFFGSIEFGEVVAEEGSTPPARIGPFNVRLDGDQIIASLRVTVAATGDPLEMLVLANLDFENTDLGPELSISNVRINSLPIPGLAGVVSSMIASKISEAPWPEELVEMWENIKSVQVESGKLITEVGLRRT